MDNSKIQYPETAGDARVVGADTGAYVPSDSTPNVANKSGDWHPVPGFTLSDAVLASEQESTRSKTPKVAPHLTVGESIIKNGSAGAETSATRDTAPFIALAVPTINPWGG
jgi:hypothetical protein